MRNADAETGRVTLQCLNGKSTSLFHKLVFPSAQKLQTTSSKRAWWQMTSLPMSIFLNIPELITYLQPLSCQIWGLLVQNFYCSILDLQHIHPTYLFVTAWLHKNERELLLSVSWNHPFLYQTGLVEKNPAKKSRPKKAKKIHPKFHLSGWLFLAFIEKCVFY